MFGFKKEDMKTDEKFKGSIFDKVGMSPYLCPSCEAHLKETDGELICLNGCHLPMQWQINFSKEMAKLSAFKKSVKKNFGCEK
jgi:hypothetical protein